MTICAALKSFLLNLYYILMNHIEDLQPILCMVYVDNRELMETEALDNHLAKKEVIGVTPSGKIQVLAEYVGTGWSLMNSDWSSSLQNKFNEDGRMFELDGSRKVGLSGHVI